MADELPGPVAGSAEAAAILGVEQTRIGRHRREGRMPPTVCPDLHATPVWAVEDIERMAANGQRWPGGPPAFKVKLLGTAEAATKFSVSKRAVARWREQGIFPEPNQNLARTPVWTAGRLRRFQLPRDRRARAS